MSDAWNPDLYLKFQQERTQPSIDLVSRIELESPVKIVDVGCGPGNSTKAIADRWPQAELTGVDPSEEMIATATRDYPDWSWIRADIRDLPSEPGFDLVYSNAALQWIPDHEALIPHLFGMIRGSGALAVQVPLYEGMPVRRVVDTVAKRPPWSDLISDVHRLVFGGARFYYDALAPIARKIAIWQTAYFHEMESHASIVEMLKSTGIRPYTSQLTSEADRERFLQEVKDEIKPFYPLQKNGRVLFPFNRLFFVAYR